MKWLLLLNGLALLVYATFVAAFLFADVRLFPQLSTMMPPPEAVGTAIREGGDVEGLRAIAMILYDHVRDQAAVVNSLVDDMVFWGRLHFLAALGLACLNVALLLRLRRATGRKN
ncbi:MAG: hypothetical protein AMJ66_11300 [Betaproteobacteria bacterium SG8_40]|jgi:hypothetical protein|nr:MAG: hypothetical protein AMJ66_11300 [Betaproteobacteria bacterium SG8_40]